MIQMLCIHRAYLLFSFCFSLYRLCLSIPSIICSISSGRFTRRFRRAALLAEAFVKNVKFDCTKASAFLRESACYTFNLPGFLPDSPNVPHSYGDRASLDFGYFAHKGFCTEVEFVTFHKLRHFATNPCFLAL